MCSARWLLPDAQILANLMNENMAFFGLFTGTRSALSIYLMSE